MLRPRPHRGLSTQTGDITGKKYSASTGALVSHRRNFLGSVGDTPESRWKPCRLAQAGTIISYDLNYRDSLWKAIAQEAAQDVNAARLAGGLMLGNEEIFRPR